jgi:3-dehydroquinate dehydratase
MITANNMVLADFQAGQSDFEIALMESLARATSKYNTTVSLKPRTYSLAPIVISDAVLAANCDVTEACSVPSVLKNTKIQMNAACTMCLTTLSDGEIAVYGIDEFDPQPTAELERAKATEQALQLTYSALKTYWLGNTGYVAADLNNAALLPAYKKDNGQWKKIIDANPAHVTITENAAATTALQMTVTYDEALAYIDAMFVAQSVSMQMVVNSMKTGWMTVEIFDVIQSQRQKNELAGIRFVEIENEFGNFDSFVYRDVQFIKYEHFTAAIRDLKPGTAGTILLPHRIVLTVGLPMLSFPKPIDSTYSTKFEPVAKSWEAGTILTIMQPEAVSGDYYVVAY